MPLLSAEHSSGDDHPQVLLVGGSNGGIDLRAPYQVTIHTNFTDSGVQSLTVASKLNLAANES